jgi:hypothetical protein
LLSASTGTKPIFRSSGRPYLIAISCLQRPWF